MGMLLLSLIAPGQRASDYQHSHMIRGPISSCQLSNHKLPAEILKDTEQRTKTSHHGQGRNNPVPKTKPNQETAHLLAHSLVLFCVWHYSKLNSFTRSDHLISLWFEFCIPVKNTRGL